MTTQQQALYRLADELTEIDRLIDRQADADGAEAHVLRRLAKHHVAGAANALVALARLRERRGVGA